MNTKYIKTLFAALALGAGSSVLLTSCNDTLDKPSYTADDVDKAFENINSAELFVKGCYRGLVHEELYRQYNTGETVTIPAEEDLSGSKWMVGNYKFDPIMPAVFGTYYSEGYRLIEACNIGIYNISKMDASAKRDALLAELYTLRGYIYSNLICLFGDVPAVWLPLETLDPQDENTFYPRRTSRDEIYDRVINEIVEHIDALPDWKSSGYGSAPERLTKQAAQGLLARICLQAGGYSLRWDLATNSPSTLQMKRRDDEGRVRELYQIADRALADCISSGQHQLVQAGNGMSATMNLFYHYCQRQFEVSSQEFMFQTAQYGTTTSNSFGVYNGQPGCRGGVYGARKSLQAKLPTYYLSFDPNDNRRDVSCTNYSITPYKSESPDEDWAHMSTGYDAVGSGKFRIEWCTEPAAAAKRNLDVPILRYADVLLMYAETQNYLHNGPTAQAVSALQQVRDRAGVGHLPVPTSQADFLEALMQERKWEFADEFLLRADLIRTNLLDSHLKACKQDMMDLADRTGKYANVAEVRLYKLDTFKPVYGHKFLALEYIDLTPEEAATIATAPKNSAQITKFNNAIQAILQAHGITEGTWYPINMFDAWTSTYNKNCRIAAGYISAATAVLQIGGSIYTKATRSVDGVYPAWIDQLFYGYEQNKTELSPFANKSVGHPLVDNPNLTQHPGYLN